MNNRGTPGPWFTDPLGVLFSQVTQKRVLTGPRNDIEAYANAKLQAGAPDLLAFVKAVNAHAKDPARAGDPTWQQVKRESEKLIFEIEGF